MATLGEPVVGTAVYGPVRTVVWEDGGREAPSYPIAQVILREAVIYTASPPRPIQSHKLSSVPCPISTAPLIFCIGGIGNNVSSGLVIQ